MEIREVTAERVLNPTSIDLGDYVINPYRGCAFSCLYCYAQFNKVATKDKRGWGEYVDIRINSADLLRKEIEKNRPKRVLLGSTTECFLPVCKKYSLISDILDILNESGIYYSILTRSPLITDYLKQLTVGFCENIYFTINNFDKDLKRILEPKSPGFEDRISSVLMLIDNNINVIPYFSPVLPGITETESIFESFEKVDSIDFEGLNFNLGNIDEIIFEIADVYPEVSIMYEKMKKEKAYYEEVWSRAKKEIIINADKYKKNPNVFVHGYNGFFENKYR